MSDNVDMYQQAQEDEDAPVAFKPAVDAPVKIEPLGGAARITVDGKELIVATPLMFQQLQQQVIRADNELRDLRTKLLKMMEQMSVQQTQILQLRKELANKVSYD